MPDPLSSSIRKGTALVRRKGWIEATGEHHYGRGSDVGRLQAGADRALLGRPPAVRSRPCLTDTGA